MAKKSRLPLDKLDPVEAWKPWAPDAADPWNLKWAGHLYRRAAFGATWQELEDALQDGPEPTIATLLAGKPGYEAVDRSFEDLIPTLQGFQGEFAAGPIQGWWLSFMRGTFHPLRERMTLFWHNHFATSIAKVQQPQLMLQQNALIRKHALGKFGPFLLEMSKDPAMMLWLDSNSNVKGKPNENYAREVMELFTLGVGNYTEKDIREAARAFTGWQTTTQYASVARTPGVPNGPQTTFTFNRLQHDDGTKTVLGQTGNWDGGDIVRILLEQPAAARFLVRKLYRHFISESETPPDSLIEPLAGQLRKSGYDIGSLMGTMLRSRHFFSEYAYRQRIKSPAEFLVGMMRSLEGEMSLEGAAQNLPGPMDGLGQTLFAPPNVKGWDGGKTWLNSATLLARHNLAWRYIQGEDGPLHAKVDPAALLNHRVGRDDYAGQVDFFLDLLLQPERTEFNQKAREKLVTFLKNGNPKTTAGSRLAREKARPVRQLRETVHAILLMPEYQLA